MHVPEWCMFEGGARHEENAWPIPGGASPWIGRPAGRAARALSQNAPERARRPSGATTGPRTRWRLLGVLLGIAPAVWVMRAANLAEAAHLLAAAGPILLLVLAPFPLSMAMEAVGWHGILRALGQRCALVPLYRARIAAEAIVYSVPAGSIVAEGAKPTLLKGWCGVPLPEAIASVGATRFLLLLSHAFYLAAGALLAQDSMRHLSAGLLGRPGLEWLGLGAALVVLFAALGMASTFALGSPASALGHAAGRTPLRWLQRRSVAAAEGLQRTDGHLRTLFRTPGRWLPASGALFLAGWVSESAETFLVLHCLGVRIGFADVLALETLLTLARSLSLLTPAGLGIQDAGYAVFLGAYGVPDAATVGLSFSVIKRAKEAVWILVGYGLLARWWPRATEQPRELGRTLP